MDWVFDRLSMNLHFFLIARSVSGFISVHIALIFQPCVITKVQWLFYSEARQVDPHVDATWTGRASRVEHNWKTRQ